MTNPLQIGHAHDETIWVTPAEVRHIYVQREGHDYIGLSITDPRLGPIVVMFTPDGAEYVARGLAHFQQNLPQLPATVVTA